MGKSHFEILFHVTTRASITKVIRIAYLFAKLVNEDENRAITDEVLKMN